MPNVSFNGVQLFALHWAFAAPEKIIISINDANISRISFVDFLYIIYFNCYTIIRLEAQKQLDTIDEILSIFISIGFICKWLIFINKFYSNQRREINLLVPFLWKNVKYFLKNVKYCHCSWGRPALFWLTLFSIHNWSVKSLKD